MPREGGRKVPHPAALRAEALELAARVGPSRAADELHLSPDTIKSWQKRASGRAHRELARANLVMPTRKGLSWQARRVELLGALSELASEATAASRLAVQENRAKPAADFAIVAARALDKCLLLGGDPTSRSESRSMTMRVDSQEMVDLRREIDALERELEAG